MNEQRLVFVSSDIKTLNSLMSLPIEFFCDRCIEQKQYGKRLGKERNQMRKGRDTAGEVNIDHPNQISFF